MSTISHSIGNAFEKEVDECIRHLLVKFPHRVKITPQEEVKLRDGRIKKVDFGLDYKTLSSTHRVAIECQDRDGWSSEILDKIFSIRNHSFRNRFWFVYRNVGFLTPEVKSLLDGHGVMHFSLSEFLKHIVAVAADLEAADTWDKKQPVSRGYQPPSDPAMISR